MIRVSSIHRYPVKGLSHQVLSSVMLTAGETLPFDRAWAIENGPSGFTPDDPKFLPKISFLTRMRQEKLATLSTGFDDTACRLAVSAPGGERVHAALNDPDERRGMEAFLAGYFAEVLRGPPRIVHAAGHAFTDTPTKCVSLINLATVRDMESRLGVAIDPLRFRANLLIEDAPAWSEFAWLETTVEIGEARLRAFDRTQRCAAINVDPQTGRRDLALPRHMLTVLGHADCGIHLTVDRPGVIQIGDTLQPGTGG